MSQPTATTAAKKRHTGLIIIGATILISVGVFVVSTLTGEKGLPRIDRPQYEAAKKKWDGSGVNSYDMDLVFVGGLKPKEIHLEVRDGKVTKCLENGKPPVQQDAWDNWLIDKQFLMIAQDLDKEERNAFNVQKNVMITLHAVFDPEFGFPRRYHRKTRGASPLQSQWRVERFEPIHADKATPVQ